MLATKLIVIQCGCLKPLSKSVRLSMHVHTWANIDDNAAALSISLKIYIYQLRRAFTWWEKMQQQRRLQRQEFSINRNIPKSNQASHHARSFQFCCRCPLSTLQHSICSSHRTAQRCTWCSRFFLLLFAQVFFRSEFKSSSTFHTRKRKKRRRRRMRTNESCVRFVCAASI